MREIKFRAWDEWDKKFLYTDEFYTNGEDFVLIDEDRYDTFHGPITNHVDVIIEQYTGLKDKNGKEIYEGDIINDGSVGIGVVEYGRLGWRIVYKKWYDSSDIKTSYGKWFGDFLDSELKYIEVIGNIHENPELLEV